MPVKTQHPEYTFMCGKWERCIDVCAGQDTVHAAGRKYLPSLSAQTATDYANYIGRTPFYNATWRTLVGLQGMIFRKPPQVNVPDIVIPMLNDITLDGTPLHIFALEATEECLKVGRLGVWTDFPVVDVENTTLADSIKQNDRPSLRMYTALSIINWKTKTINNRTVLSMVVLTEVKNIPKDEFEDEIQVQYRVLDLVQEENKFVYRVRVIIIVKNQETGKEEEITLSTAYPIINSQKLEYIPFQFIGVDDVNWQVDEPPLIDLVDMNLSHYRSTADYEHGCHYTGLPTAVISGYTKDPAKDESFYIGSMEAWVFPNPNAKASYLEFTGQGLGALKENIDTKANYMAVLGARMLESQIKGVEAANTAAIHRGGEQSMLSSVAQAISIGIEKALKTFAKFAGADEKEVTFELNRDFFPIPMDALTLTAIIAGWQNQAYSYDTMFALLKKGEIVLSDDTPEEEQALIDANPPPMLDAAAPTTPGNGSAAVKKPKAVKGAAGGAAKTITQLQKTK